MHHSCGLPWLTVVLMIFTLAVLPGCTSMAPAYTRPDAPVPQTYPMASPEAHSTPVPELAWQEYFNDPTLIRLLQLALENNRDLRMAILRVDEARSAYRIQRSERFPQINVDGRGARSRVPADLSPMGQATTGSEYRAELGLTTWELDLWGRVRSLEGAALESWLATEAGRQAARVALIAEVANSYLTLRELDERVQIVRQSVDSREKSYRIFQRRYEVGSTSKLDVTQVQTLLTQAQTQWAQLEQQRDVQLNTLRFLVGGDSDLPPQQASSDQTTVFADLQPGLPAELLTNRPDIIAAEHRLRAANANIGAARAAFFPRIALTGSLGSASAELDGLFRSGSRSWTFAPTISLPIFDAGRRRADLELSEIRRDMAVAEYEQTIQSAFREVADTLAIRLRLREQLDVQLISRAAQTERARLAQLRYDNGSATYLEVLDAERSLLDAEQQVVQTRRALLSNQVTMYSALGGGSDLAASAAPTDNQAPSTQPLNRP
ncbi:efflux transporter outer membrane subunit [Desulfobulbus oligotrophicus]|uniref:Efflux transporter outer membrane subunit n=2 Tax=Desulfobulbus oligotrophicus TaxID=1909699 RepID=A0A7T6ARN3_9BACT|nr:efflux transporter outer membrane subunit [Desulfobulbus oligotrophicus]